MLDYTRAMLDKTASDIKKFANAIAIVAQSIYIAYLVYAIIAGAGFLVVNIVLVSLSVVCLLVYIMTMGDEDDTKEEKKRKKALRKTSKKVRKIIKFIVLSFTLAVTVYGAVIAADDISAFSIIMIAIMMISWMLTILFWIIANAFNQRKTLFVEAIKRDVEFVTKPATAVGNFFKKFTGGADESEKEEKKPEIPQKITDKLEAIHEHYEEKKEAKREARGNKPRRRDILKARAVAVIDKCKQIVKGEESSSAEESENEAMHR